MLLEHDSNKKNLSGVVKLWNLNSGNLWVCHQLKRKSQKWAVSSNGQSAGFAHRKIGFESLRVHKLYLKNYESICSCSKLSPANAPQNYETDCQIFLDKKQAEKYKEAKEKEFPIRWEELNGIGNKTLGYYTSGQKYLSSKCQEIRTNARRVLESSEREKVCQYCHNHEFDAILEVHHLKGILEFDEDTLIKEINNENNLVWLCPNHHIMLEKGLISLE